jgi:Uma2 family endonuclease
MSVAELLNYTYDDYKEWEGEWELIEGIPVSMAPAPLRIHQNIAGEILFELKRTLDEEQCPECIVSYENDWKVSEETVLRPDIVFTCGDEHEAYLTKAPKIIVEVLSPTTAKKDETVKFDIYEAEGVDYYILVYPEDLRAKVYRLKEDRYIKVGDFTHEPLEFDALDCPLSLDFGRVFGKFRRGKESRH